MSCRRQWRRWLSVRGRLQLRARKKAEARRMLCSAECERAPRGLRRELACPGHTRQGAGDARPAAGSTRRARPDGVGH